MNGNNEFYQNSMINARKDNDEWKNAAGTCSTNMIEKTITENGQYAAKEDGADGYSKVTVDVSGGGGGETFEVELNVGWNTGQENVSFSSSKTLQEVISAHLSGKDVNFSVKFTYDGTLLTSNAATYLYIESGNMIVVLFSTLSGSTAITLPITWATDSNSGIMYNKSQIIYIIPN